MFGLRKHKQSGRRIRLGCLRDPVDPVMSDDDGDGTVNMRVDPSEDLTADAASPVASVRLAASDSNSAVVFAGSCSSAIHALDDADGWKVVSLGRKGPQEPCNPAPPKFSSELDSSLISRDPSARQIIVSDVDAELESTTDKKAFSIVTRGHVTPISSAMAAGAVLVLCDPLSCVAGGRSDAV